jgi:hypothetical protein
VKSRRAAGAYHPALIADTEVPGHRPALVVPLQWLTRRTNRLVLFGWAARSKRFARSPLALGRIFSDVSTFDFDEFFRVTLEPIARSETLRLGTLRFAQDFDFGQVDRLRDSYGALTMPTQVLWVRTADPPLGRAGALRRLPPCFDIVRGPGCSSRRGRRPGLTGAILSSSIER